MNLRIQGNSLFDSLNAKGNDQAMKNKVIRRREEKAETQSNIKKIKLKV